MRVGNSHSRAAEDFAASWGEVFPTFRNIVLPSLSWVEWTKKKLKAGSLKTSGFTHPTTQRHLAQNTVLCIVLYLCCGLSDVMSLRFRCV